MKRLVAILMAGCMLLSGCSTMFDGSYVNITPYEGQVEQPDESAVSVSDYAQLYAALRNMTQNGKESGVVYVSEYAQEALQSDVDTAVRKLMAQDPITAYAVEKIDVQIGTNAGQSAIAVSISYLHNKSQIRKIKTVKTMDEARKVVRSELENFSSGVAIYISEYEASDIQQWVEDHAANYPELVMEVPEVTVNLYPDNGDTRVVELKFNYRSSRDALRVMQSEVTPIFAAAQAHVSADVDQRLKFAKLYDFLMGCVGDYKLETSITPSYSLLIHDVGDAKAFASVYAAMCRLAGLECATVSGTRQGSAWYWNIVSVDGAYYHVDILRCSENGGFRMMTDSEMTGYVWDYSAMPAIME